MARKKAKTSNFRTRTRTVVKRVKSKAVSKNPTQVMLNGALYGAGRGIVSSAIRPLTSKIPFGQYADEVGMLGISYLAAKGKMGSSFKELGRAGLYIESAVIGNALTKGALPSVGVKASTGGF